VKVDLGTHKAMYSVLALKLGVTLGHDQRWRSGVVARKKVGESSGMKGRHSRVAEGGAHPFIGVEGRQGGAGRVVTVGNNGGYLH
jgi:hypothetical protein